MIYTLTERGLVDSSAIVFRNRSIYKISICYDQYLGLTKADIITDYSYLKRIIIIYSFIFSLYYAKCIDHESKLKIYFWAFSCS